jgi:hypothetical protein
VLLAWASYLLGWTSCWGPLADRWTLLEVVYLLLSRLWKKSMALSTSSLGVDLIMVSLENICVMLLVWYYALKSSLP